MLDSDDGTKADRLPPQTAAARRLYNVHALLKSIGVQRDGDDDIDEPKRAERLLSVLTVGKSTDQFLDKLFPLGIATESGYYETLGCVASSIGFNDNAARAIGEIWLACLNKLDISQRIELLHELVDEKSNYFFENVTGLPTLLESIVVPSNELLSWLESVLTAIDKDAFQGSFWRGLRVLADQRASVSLDLITHAIESQSKQGLRIGSFLLGTLRSKILNPTDTDRMQANIDYMALSSEPALRGCLHRSWQTTASDVGLRDEDVTSLIELAEMDECDDKACLLQVFCELVGCDKIGRESFLVLLRWLDSKIGSHLDDDSKHHVVSAAHFVIGDVRAPESTINTNDWLVKVQPVSIKCLGTWRMIERCFSALKDEPKQFQRLFVSLAAICSRTLLELFRQPRTFDRFLRDIASAKPNLMISELILSDHSDPRRLGLFLFDKLGTAGVSKRLLGKASDKRLCDVFYELQRQVMEPTSSARIMWSLTPRFESMDERMRAEFVDLLQMQAKNHPGGFRSELGKLAKDNAMIQQLLNQFAVYETAYTKTRETGIAKIRVPGAAKAARMHARHTSQRISESVDEHSIISQMCKKVFVTYGDAHGHYMAGKLSEPTTSDPMAIDFEIPQVEFSNPEEMALRRFRALSSMNDADEAVANDDDSENPSDE